VRPALRVLLLLALTVGPVVLSFNQEQRVCLQAEYFARHGMWEDILRMTRKVPAEQYTHGLAHNLSRALVETSRMADEMFTYPQSVDGLMMATGLGTPASERSRQWRRRLFFQIGDLYLRLGLLNDAEHDAHEALEIYGPHGVTLKRLALINIAKGQVAAARAFLRAGRKDLIYGRWAADTLARLDQDPSLSSDPEIARIRSVMLGPDVGYLASPLEVRCLALLKRNKRNRMAFEYLMAFYLLSRQLDKFAANIERLRDLDCHTLPRHYAEALALHGAEKGDPLELYGRWIDSDTLRKFAHFSNEVERHRATGGPERARQATRDAYGNTYFYYYVFGESGEGKV